MLRALLVLVALATFALSQRLSNYDHDLGGRNMQTFSFVKHKHIDCGLVNLRDDFYEHEESVTFDDIGKKLMVSETDTPSSNDDYDLEHRSKKTRSRTFSYEPLKAEPDRDLVANLSSCLSQQSQYYTSYSIHLTSKLTKLLFKSHFHLDERLGLLYLDKKIDREQLCVQVKQNGGPRTQPADHGLEEAQEQPEIRHKSKTFYVETTLLRDRLNRSIFESQESITTRRAEKPIRKHGRKSKNKGGKLKHVTTTRPAVDDHRTDRDKRMSDSMLRQSSSGSYQSGGGVNSMPQVDHVDCECHSEKCLIRFRFVAFRRKDMKNAVRDENSLQQLSPYKNIFLTFSVNDVNDNLPKFSKNSLYLNVSEHIGQQVEGQADCAKGPRQETGTDSLRKTRDLNRFDEASNTLIPLDEAFDLDVGKNSQIVYSLIQMDENSYKMIEMLEKEALNETLKENLVRTLIEEHTKEVYEATDPADRSKRSDRKCKSAFELIESNLNEDSMLLVSDSEAQQESGKSRFKELTPTSSDNNQLYLKINKRLDREQQDVYNFILLAQDTNFMTDFRQYLSRPTANSNFARLARKVTKSGYLVHAKNFVFIRLLITDQNDNFPQFLESKYQFHLNETTEYDLFYSNSHLAATSPMLVKPGLKPKPLQKLLRPSISISNTRSEEDEELTRKSDENRYYSKLMIDACFAMRRTIKVTAVDKDLGLNALVKFKIIQQVHRKNPNYFANLARLSMASFTSSSASLHPTSASWSTSVSPNEASQSAYSENSFSSNSQDQFEIDENDGSIYLKACKPIFETVRQNATNSGSSIRGLTRGKFIEQMSLMDFELYTKHVLVVEASDSNPFNPLQTFVSVDININDLNDNPPLVLSLIGTSCARYGLSKDHAVMSLPSGPSNSGSHEDKGHNSAPTITIQHYEANSQFINHHSRHSQYKLNQNRFQASTIDNPYSAKIAIDGLSEYSRIGKCIGQFLISDLDSKRQNRKLEAVLTDTLPSLSQDLGIGRDETENSLFIFTDINSREGHRHGSTGQDDYEEEAGLSANQTQKPSFIVKQTNEIFELFLNFEPDAEVQRVYELVLTIKDQGNPLSFVSYAQLIIRIRDENDNEPRFESSFFNFFIDEWTSNDSDQSSSQSDDNYCIGQVEARDLDYSSANSFVYYELKYIDDDEQARVGLYGGKKLKHYHHHHHQTGSSTDDTSMLDHDNLVRSLFYINQSNGFICVKNRTIFDYEQKQTYKFKVNAVNANSDKRLMNSALVQINVNDLNDNRPEFLMKEYKFLVVETDKNYVNSLYITDSHKPRGRLNSLENGRQPDVPVLMNLVGHVRAFDKDGGLNADLVYYLRPNGDKQNSFFQLNPDSIDKADKLSLDAETSEIESDKENSEAPESPPRRLLKLIDNIEEVIFVNETNGAIFLLKEIDREQITHIRFHVFVSDRKGVSLPTNEALNSSVPVIIEIIDINDSKPTCSNANYLPDNSLRAIYSINMNMNWVVDQATAKTLPMKPGYEYPIYKLDCVDKDINKNAELHFEIVQVKIKKLVTSKFLRSIKSNSSIAKRDQQANDTNSSAMISLENASVDMGPRHVNEYFMANSIFTIKPATGQIYLNISKAWIGASNSSQPESKYNLNKRFRLYAQNSIVIVKLRVKDSAIIPLSNVYNLKFRFCLFDVDTIYSFKMNKSRQSADEKYCDYELLQEYLEKSHYGGEHLQSESEPQQSVQLKSIVLRPVLSMEDVDAKNLVDRPDEYNLGGEHKSDRTTLTLNEDDNIDDSSYSGELSSGEYRPRQPLPSKIQHDNSLLTTEKNGDYSDYEYNTDSKAYIYSDQVYDSSAHNQSMPITNKLRPGQSPHIIKQKTAHKQHTDLDSSAPKLRFFSILYLVLLIPLLFTTIC